MTLVVRPIEHVDMNAVLEIYSYYILNTIVTFETSVPSISNFTKRIQTITEKFPWLVCEEDGEITGYAYACEHRSREAYRWSVDVSVYLKPDKTGKGLGKVLYNNLLKFVEFQGFVNAYAGIALPNIASARLHEFYGFSKIAQYKHVGYKGRWIDVGWWSKELNQPPENPSEPKKPMEVYQSEKFKLVV